MRRIAPPLLLALPSLAFAPAPFPKTERACREPAALKSQKELAECVRRLESLAVEWRVVQAEGGPVARFKATINVPGRGGVVGGERALGADGLPGALRRVALLVESFVRDVLSVRP